MKGNMPDNRKLAGIVVLAALLAGCNTYGTGVSPGKQTLNDLTGLVSIGGRDKEPIEYAPRPPIVAPPTTESLPPPGTATAAANWPRDPDEAERQRKAAAAQKRGPQTQEEILADPGFRLPKSGAPALAKKEDPSNATEQIFQMQRQKSEVKQVFATAKSGAAGAVDAEGNPVRTYLTEPPADYRVPDPEAPDAFTAAKDEKWWQIFSRKGGGTARKAGTGSQPVNTNAGP